MHKLNHLLLASALTLTSMVTLALDKPALKAAAPAPAAVPTAPPLLAHSLTISADGATVLSKDGKLVWMRCSIGQPWRDGNCQNEAKKYDHRDATNQIKLMNMSGGYAGATDWRLPTAEELQTLVFCDQGFNHNTATIKYGNNTQSSALPQACDGEKYLRPTIDPIAFPKTASAWYWTSTTDVDKVINLWGVSFANGAFAPISRHHQTMARAVRVAK